MLNTSNRQGGLSTFVTIAAFVGLGLVFFTIFLLSTSGGQNGANNQANNQDQGEETDSNEPPFIRIPENSKVFQNDTFGFTFAYPDSFGELTILNNGSSSSSEAYRAESGLAAQKPVGNGTAVMNGRLGVYVYSKENFKVVINNNDVTVGPTKTGNDTTWKIVSRGSSSQDISIGDAYNIKSIKSQTGVTVFDFAYSPASNFKLGRWVFEADDKFVMITLPSVTKLDGSTLSEDDQAAYTTISANLAKTVRAKTLNTDTSDNSQASENTDSNSTN